MNDKTKEALAEMAREQSIAAGLCTLALIGLLTPNEVRAFFGLPPAINGDSLK